MGKIENGINGGFTGTVGAVTGYYLNGKWVIRSKRRKSIKNKTGSADQKTCRSRFTMMQTFLSPIVGFIRIGFNLESKKRMMTAHNVAKSFNMLNAQNAAGEIDYGAVRLSFGNLTGAEGVKLEHDDAGVHFSWTDNSNGDYTRKHDQAMLMVYDVDNKTPSTKQVVPGGQKKGKAWKFLLFIKKRHSTPGWLSLQTTEWEYLRVPIAAVSFFDHKRMKLFTLNNANIRN